MVSATLYLLHYNNYYNRIVKKEDSLSDYLPYQLGNVITGVNFIPNNFIDTTQIINWEYDDPDYLIVVDENSEIQSRWFIISTKRTRAGQLQLSLHRDLIVDYYDNLMDPETAIFVEKSILPSDNNLIFNSEDMSFNQIKQSETLLKDQSGCPWICIYAASKDGNNADTTFNVNIDTDVHISRTFESEDDFNNWNIKQAIDSGTQGVSNYILSDLTLTATQTNIQYLPTSGTTKSWAYISNLDGSSYRRDQASGDRFITQQNLNDVTAIPFQGKWNQIQTALKNYVLSIDKSLYDEIVNYTNQYIRVNQSGGGYKYYTIRAISDVIDASYNPKISDSPQLWDIIRPILSPYGVYYNTSDIKPITYAYKANATRVYLVDVTSSIDTLELNIGSQRYHLIDSPYDLFCIPYSDNLNIINSLNSSFTNVVASKQIALSTARALIEKYAGANQIYDAQILPYCPLTSTNILNDGTNITIDLNDSSNFIATPIQGTLSDTVVGYVMHVTISSFNRDIVLTNPIVIDDYKIESECDMYRLCSPNYNGIFEFNAAKNGGIELFHLECTYKPFTPYIKLYPNWGRLYGQDNVSDSRGLICGGDFSLPMTTSAWATYELQNKNYQLSFDRQIQNMEVNNSVQRIQEMVNIGVGTLSGAGTGAVVGNTYGGPIGAGIGAAVGGVASLGGGIADYFLNEKLRQEALDYTKDQFGYQLGNIKALPQSLSKVSSFNIDNKYFPFLEYYSCSEVEKNALRNKIKYNGMTTMVIGNMQDYTSVETEYPKYFKGRLIRLEGIDEDYHVINAIADELYKGVFI